MCSEVFAERSPTHGRKFLQRTIFKSTINVEKYLLHIRLINFIDQFRDEIR